MKQSAQVVQSSEWKWVPIFKRSLASLPFYLSNPSNLSIYLSPIALPAAYQYERIACHNKYGLFIKV